MEIKLMQRELKNANLNKILVDIENQNKDILDEIEEVENEE